MLALLAALQCPAMTAPTQATLAQVVLALDTATDRLAAGLLAPGVSRAVNEAGGALASARLIPLLMGLLQDAGLAMPQVQAVAFGQGPGAFTGLRTACAVSQGLAFAHGTPVLPAQAWQVQLGSSGW